MTYISHMIEDNFYTQNGEKIGHWKDVFPIGSEWRCIGNWKAVVIEHGDDYFITKQNHRYGDGLVKHAKQGGTFMTANNLSEPWGWR